MGIQCNIFNKKLEFMPKHIKENAVFTINKCTFSSIVAFKRPYIIDSDAKVQVLFCIDQQSLKDYQISIILPTFKAMD